MPSLFFAMKGRTVRWRLGVLLLSVGALGAGSTQGQTGASATVWRCGQLFTNQPQPGQACEPLSSLASTVVEGTRVIPNPAKAWSSAARDRPDGAAQLPAVPVGPAGSVALPPSPHQARMLLQAELREQEERWQQLQRQWNQGQPIGTPQQPVGSAAYLERVSSLREQLHRTEADLAALRRELARLP